MRLFSFGKRFCYLYLCHSFYALLKQTVVDIRIIMDPIELKCSNSLIVHLVGFHQMKLTEISKILCDILSESLDPSMDGLSGWEQFGERLLGKNALELQKFKRFISPTAAILNQKMGEAPATTLAEVLDVLDEIGRIDVVEHATKVIQSEERTQEQIPLPCLAQLHQSSSHDSGYEDTRTKLDSAALLQHSSTLPVHAPVTISISSNDASSKLEGATRGRFDIQMNTLLKASSRTWTLSRFTKQNGIVTKVPYLLDVLTLLATFAYLDF